MNLLNTSFERVSYGVEIKTSLLFECALGIAMITYPKLHDQLEMTRAELDELKLRLSSELTAELDYCREHNTWKMLLQLLHVKDFSSPGEFYQFLKSLSQSELKFYALPFVDIMQENNRLAASKGDREAENVLVLNCKGHAFFPQMIHFVCSTKHTELLNHLLTLLDGWYNEVILPEKDWTSGVLERDVLEKRRISQLESPHKTVLKAAGIDYKPEQGIADVILIPHVAYRPWTIQADLPAAKVFYYPVSDSSLMKSTDPFEPPGQLVQKLKAIGDEKRLRILKLLVKKELTLKEVTALVGMGKTTVHHHLTLLKAAGLVHVKGSVYKAAGDSIKGIEKEIFTFLHKET